VNKSIAPRSAAPAPLEIAERSNLVQQVMGEFAEPLDLMRQLKPWFRRLPEIHHLSVKNAAANRDRALRRCAKLPAEAVLDRAADLFREAAFAGTDEARSRVLVGLMLDGLPSARTLPSASYIDAMIDTILYEEPESQDFPGAVGFGPVVLASVARAVWGTLTFPPSIAEFMKLAHGRRSSFWEGALNAEQLIAVLQNAEDVLIQTGDYKSERQWGDGPPF
jgi:hypothetical protein